MNAIDVDKVESREIGEVYVTLAGGRKKLKYNFRALYELEQLEGQAVASLFKEGEVEKNVGIKFISHALYCGLFWVEKGKRHTLAKILEVMDPTELQQYAKICMNGITEALSGKTSEQHEKERAEAAAAAEESGTVDPTKETEKTGEDGTGSATSSEPSPLGSPSSDSGS